VVVLEQELLDQQLVEIQVVLEVEVLEGLLLLVEIHHQLVHHKDNQEELHQAMLQAVVGLQ
tara:strand:- start:297 stop:479 length:183 start_codon:yes stop_codon:yes gene_type:complete